MYNYIPAPYSIYNGIYKLLPGSILEIKGRQSGHAPAQSGSDPNLPEPVPFWSYPSNAKTADDKTEAQLIDTLDCLLTESISGKMVADVPVGVMLSGGIDSSLVAAVMQKCSEKRINTFSAGFHEKDYNEAHHAAAIARHLNTEHHELFVDREAVIAEVPSIAGKYDEPFADISQLPVYLVARLARREVKVCLTGDGGDELFGGYNRYILGQKLWSCLIHIPSPLRRLTARILELMPLQGLKVQRMVSGLLTTGMINPVTVKSNLRKIPAIVRSSSPEQLYDALVNALEPGVCEPGVMDPRGAFKYRTCEHDYGTPADWMMCRDFLYYLPDDILVKLDRACMSVSLESRAPFLDHRIIGFASSLPHSCKLREGQGKWISRQLLYSYIPETLVNRPKTGFSVPLGNWLVAELREWAQALLDRYRQQSVCFHDSAKLDGIWRDYLSGRRDNQHLIWPVLAFQSWYDSLEY